MRFISGLIASRIDREIVGPNMRAAPSFVQGPHLRLGVPRVCGEGSSLIVGGTAGHDAADAGEPEVDIAG
jgi:hypothetical protein